MQAPQSASSKLDALDASGSYSGFVKNKDFAPLPLQPIGFWSINSYRNNPKISGAAARDRGEGLI